MKKMLLAVVLGLMSLFLVGCSSYELTEEDWYTIATYQEYKYLPIPIEVQYGPFIDDKKDMNAIETYEEFEKRCNSTFQDYDNFNKEELKDINKAFFKEYLICTLSLYASGSENDTDIYAENLYIKGKTLHIPISFDSPPVVFGWDSLVIIFLGVKKSIVDKVNKVELDILNRYDNSKGSKYYQYK